MFLRMYAFSALPLVDGRAWRYYVQNMAYYKISNVDGRVTNPEQQIASDVPRFSSDLSELVQEDLTAVTDCILYTWRLCSYTSPKYFFWILGYVLGARAMIKNFSPACGKLMSKEQQLEGEYQQLHSCLRTHSECVAFYGGERMEEFNIQQKFRDLVRHMRVVNHDHWWFGMIQDFLVKYLGATVAVILIIEPFFAGNLRPETSTLGRATMLSCLRYHTSVVISLFQSLGTLSIISRRLNRLSGYADHINELIIKSRELSGDGKASLECSESRNYFSEADFVEFSGVKKRVDESENSKLENSLIRQEDSIIFGLLERSQYCYDADTYDPNAFVMDGFHGSLIAYILKETEKFHAKVGRYKSPDEHPFFSDDLPEPLLPPLQYPQVLHPVADSITINKKVWDMYFRELIPRLVKEGNDGNCGSGAVCDTICLQIKNANFAYENFSVSVSKSANEVVATYLKDETGMDLVIRLPVSYPLRAVDVECTRSLGIGEVKQRKWLMSTMMIV